MARKYNNTYRLKIKGQEFKKALCTSFGKVISFEKFDIEKEIAKGSGSISGIIMSLDEYGWYFDNFVDNELVYHHTVLIIDLDFISIGDYELVDRSVYEAFRRLLVVYLRDIRLDSIISD